MQAPSQSPVLRASEAADYLAIGLSTLWWKAKREADFPKPRKISQGITVWSRAELDEYLMRAKAAV